MCTIAAEQEILGKGYKYYNFEFKWEFSDTSKDFTVMLGHYPGSYIPLDNFCFFFFVFGIDYSLFQFSSSRLHKPQPKNPKEKNEKKKKKN